jgi:hypothetical protein
MLSVRTSFFIKQDYYVNTPHGNIDAFTPIDVTETSLEEIELKLKYYSNLYEQFDVLKYAICYRTDNDDYDTFYDEISLMDGFHKGSFEEAEESIYYLNELARDEKAELESYKCDVSLLVQSRKRCPEASLLYIYLNIKIYEKLKEKLLEGFQKE